MPNFTLSQGTDVILVLLSSLAVIISLLRARVQLTEAQAAAVKELAAGSQDLRQRIAALEAQNQQKDLQIQDLRRRAAQIPTLDAQVRHLTAELAQVKGRHADERTALLAQLKRKDQIIAQLRRALNAAQPR